MRCICRTLTIIFISLTVALSIASADGLMFADKKAIKEQVEKILINEPEQKAVIFFKDKVETLIISPSYDGAPENFAWVVPVPAKPKVELGEEVIFHELAEITYPIIAAAPLPDSNTKKDSVKLLERKIVGKYDVSVLSSEDGKALLRWLDENGYHVPEKALKPIQEYIKDGWTFVASKIADNSQSTADGLRNGTLAPLKLIFPANKPVYPLRLSQVNPEPFDLLIYMVLPQPVSAYHRVIPLSNTYCVSKAYSYTKGLPSCYLDDEMRPSFPSLSSLHNGNMVIIEAVFTWDSGKVLPQECKRDLIWDIPAIPWRKPSQPASQDLFHEPLMPW